MITWDVSSLLIGEVVNVVDIFCFVTKKQASQIKGSLFCLKFAMHTLPYKPGNISFKQALVDGYNIHCKVTLLFLQVARLSF